MRVADGAGVVALAMLPALCVKISTTRVSIKAVGLRLASDETMGVEQAARKRTKEKGRRKETDLSHRS